MATLNPIGAVVIEDGELPRSFTGAALLDIVAGDLVYSSGTGPTVTSEADSFISNDIKLAPIFDSGQVNGVALNTAASGTTVNYVTVATRGDYIFRAIGTVTPGTLVQAISGTIPGVQTITSGTTFGTYVLNGIIGRAKTPAASGTNAYALVALNL